MDTYSHGIFIHEISFMFKNRYGYDLNFYEHGYTSVLGMFQDLKSIFR